MTSFNCSICSETLDKNPAERQARGLSGTEINISATPCGHMFHTYCIQKWLTGDLPSCKQCPYCRKEVPGLRCNPLYPNIHDDNSISMDPSNAVIPCNHENKIRSLESQLTSAELSYENLKRLYVYISEELESVNYRMENQRSAWLKKLKKYEGCNNIALKAQTRLFQVEGKLKHYSEIHAMIQGTEDKVEEEILAYPPTVASIKHLLEMKHIMTSKYKESKKINDSLRAEKTNLKMKLDKKNDEYKDLQNKYEISRTNGRFQEESSTYPSGSDLDNDVDLIRLFRDKGCPKVINKMKAIKPTATISSLESNSPVKSTSSKSSSSKLKSRSTAPLLDNNEHSQKRLMFSELLEQDPSQPNSESSGKSKTSLSAYSVWKDTVLLSSDNDESDVLSPSDNEQDDYFVVRRSVPGAPLLPSYLRNARR